MTKILKKSLLGPEKDKFEIYNIDQNSDKTISTYAEFFFKNSNIIQIFFLAWAVSIMIPWKTDYKALVRLFFIIYQNSKFMKEPAITIGSNLFWH